MFRRIILIAISLFIISNMISYSQEPFWVKIPKPELRGDYKEYFVTDNGTVFLSDYYTLLRTTDYQNWDTVYHDEREKFLNNESIQMDEDSKGNIYIATKHLILKSNDYGNNWETIRNFYTDTQFDGDGTLGALRIFSDDAVLFTYRGRMFLTNLGFSTYHIIMDLGTEDSGITLYQLSRRMSSEFYQFFNRNNIFQIRIDKGFGKVIDHGVQHYLNGNWNFLFENKLIFYKGVILSETQYLPFSINDFSENVYWKPNTGYHAGFDFQIGKFDDQLELIEVIETDFSERYDSVKVIGLQYNQDTTFIAADYLHGFHISYDSCKTWTEISSGLDTPCGTYIYFDDKGYVYGIDDDFQIFRSRESILVYKTPIQFKAEGRFNDNYLSWQPDYAEDVLYNVYRSDNEDGNFELIAEHIADRFYSDTSAKHTKEYWYKVSSFRPEIEKESEPTQALSARMPERITAPESLIGEVKHNAIYLDWDEVNDTLEYRLYRGVEGNYELIYQGEEINYMDNEIEPWVKYHYYVVSYSSYRDQESLPTDEVIHWLVDEIAPPTLTAKKKVDAIQLSWTKVQMDGISYNLYKRELDQEYGEPLLSDFTGSLHYDRDYEIDKNYAYSVEAERTEFEAKSDLSNEEAVLFTDVYEYADAELEVQIVDDQIRVLSNKQISSILLYTYDGREIAGVSNSKVLTIPVGISGLYFAVIEMDGGREIVSVFVK